MKHSILLVALGLTAFGAAAQEVGNVVSSTPVIQQVAVPRQVCNNQPVVVQRQPSGVGALVGAIAGAAIGNTIGHGGGRAAAIGLGAVGGAAVGNSVEGNQAYVAGPLCTTETAYENRTVAWNVTYEYNGRQHTVQMPYDPGPTIPLQVSPVGGSDYAAPPVAQYAPQPQYAQPAVVAPAVTYPAAPPVVVTQPVAPIVYQAAPAYPVYAAPYYRPPVTLNFGYVYHGGHRHHRHWR